MKFNRLFLLSFLSIPLLFSCETKGDKPEEISLESLRDEVEATQVTVAQAEKRSFDYLINASGKVEARQKVSVFIERT